MNNYEWYNADKHREKLINLFCEILITNTVLDVRMVLMNDGNSMYQIYGNPIIHIKASDYRELWIEAQNKKNEWYDKHIKEVFG